MANFFRKTSITFLLTALLALIFAGCSNPSSSSGSGTGTTTSGFVKMVWIPGGSFRMGSPATEPGRNPDEIQHLVTVSSFYMGKYEVTQSQYKTVTGYNPSYHTGDNNLPVESVTWYDAVEFCNKLSAQEGLMPVYTIGGRTPASGYPITDATVTANWSNNGYRLPTEAEWEYACRGDYLNKATETATAPFGIGAGTKITGDMANFNSYYPYALPGGEYSDLSGTGYKDTTTIVGSYSPNNYGLYDMHGNVDEWCWDWYDVYPSVGLTDYRGPISGDARVMRGGGWAYPGRSLRSAWRDVDNPYYWAIDYGFRVVRP